MRTREEYDRHIERYLMPVFGDVPVKHVRREHMTALMSQYAETPTLARAIKRTASTMWTFAIDGLAWLDANPFMRMEGRRNRSADGQLPLSEGEIARFRAANPIGSQERLAFEIGLCSALRISDVLSMPTDTLLARAEGVQTGKTGSIVLLALSAEARAAFKEYTAATTHRGTPLGRWLFPGGSKGRLHRRTLSGDMAAAFDRAGIQDKRFHALRYTACIRLFEAGFGYDQIARQAGHSMAAMAKKYCEKRRDALGNATIMDGFDARSSALEASRPSPSSTGRWNSAGGHRGDRARGNTA